MAFKDKLHKISTKNQFANSPWFKAIFNGDLTKEQIIRGEIQHYLRVRSNSRFLGNLVASAEEQWDHKTFEIARENYKDEMCEKRSHSDLMYAILKDAGITKEDVRKVKQTPGTIAALSMLRSASTIFSPVAQLAIFALPELQYGGRDGMAARMYNVLTEKYGFSHEAAITYHVHEFADAVHGPKQINHIIKRVEEEPELEAEVLFALEYGLIAFNYAWDGSYQAAVGDKSDE